MLNWIVGRGRLPILVLTTVITLVFLYYCSRLEIELSNKSMNSINNELSATNDLFHHLFGNDEPVIVGVTTDDALSMKSLQLLTEMDADIKGIAGVSKVESLVSTVQFKDSPDGVELVPLLRVPVTEKGIANARKAIPLNPLITKRLISPDGKSAAILITLVDDSRTIPIAVSEIRAHIRHYADRCEVHVSGFPVQKSDVASYVQADQMIIIPLTLLTLALFMYACFRSWQSIFIALSMTGVALIWTMGSYSLAGYQLNTITSLMAPAILVLGVAMSVHFYQTWINVCHKRKNGPEAVQEVMRILLFPTVFVTFTTAFGFLALLVTDIPAVKQLGMFGSLGILYQYVIVAFVLPVILCRLSPPDYNQGYMEGLRHFVDRIVRFVLTQRFAIIAVTVIISALSVVGIFKIKNNTNLVHFLKKSAPLYIDTTALDHSFNGIHTLEFIVAGDTDGSVATVDCLTKVQQFTAEVSTLPDVASIISAVDLISSLYGRDKHLPEIVLPKNQQELDEILDLLQASEGDEWTQLIDSKMRYTRVSVRLPSMGTAESALLAQKIIAIGHGIFGTGYHIRPAGAFYMMTEDSNHLVESVIESGFIAIAIILTSMGVWFRSFKAILVAIVPNVLPLLWSFGLIGFLGIDFSTGTAMIASVTFGIIIDNTIHYLAQFHRFYTNDPVDAYIKASEQAGQRIIIASAALTLGFSVGCLGQFLPTIYFSLMVAVTIFSGLICTFLLLPLGFLRLFRATPNPVNQI